MKKVFLAIKSINQFMYVITSIFIILIVVFITYDIFIRLLGGMPTKFGFDLNSWLGGAIAFLTAGYAVLHNQHIRMDILFNPFSEKKKAIVNIISAMLVFLIVYAMVVNGGAYVLMLFAKGQVSSTGWNVPIWFKWSIVPIGGILLGLQTLVNLCYDIFFVVTGKRLFEE